MKWLQVVIFFKFNYDNKYIKSLFIMLNIVLQTKEFHMKIYSCYLKLVRIRIVPMHL